MRARSARPVRLAFVAAFAAALLAGCGDDQPPAEYPPLTYDYLGKLRLSVATVDIDDGFTARPGGLGEHVEAQAPEPPAEALRQMARDRLIPGGSDGRAVFVIDDASLLQTEAGLLGTMRVHLDIFGADGGKLATAKAEVHRTHTLDDSSPDGERAALYDLTKQLMSDMNVELEYQTRRVLHAYLQDGPTIAPMPDAVQQQDLDGNQPAPPAPSTTTPVQPPGPLAPATPAPPAAPALVAPPATDSAPPVPNGAPTPLGPPPMPAVQPAQ